MSEQRSESSRKPWFSLAASRGDEAQGAARTAVRRWWASLEHHRDERAELKRAADVAACVLLPGYHRLRLAVAEHVAADPDALAAVAMVLAALRADQPGHRLPTALARNERRLGVLRLRRLLEANGPVEVARLLRRFLPLLDGSADALDVARWAYALSLPALHDRAARDFAFDYYDASPSDAA